MTIVRLSETNNKFINSHVQIIENTWPFEPFETNTYYEYFDKVTAINNT